MNIEQLGFYVAMAGIIAFATSAVLAVAERRVDLFSAMVLGVITAVGGGTVRDVVMAQPVFWAEDLSYVWVAIAASVATFFGYRLFARRLIFRVFLYVDALAAAMFAIQATDNAWDLGFGLPLAPVILGVTTSIGGGLIRDVLVQRPTLLMSRELYAIPVLAGCILYTLVLAFVPEHRTLGALVCLAITFGLRAAVIHWDLRVPDWATMGHGRE